MFKWVYRISDGVFLHGGPCEVVHDPATQGVVTLPRNPKPLTERYDEKDGIRLATAEERDTFESDRETKQTAADFDDQKLLKALAIWTAQRLGVPANTARQEILTIYRSL